MGTLVCSSPGYIFCTNPSGSSPSSKTGALQPGVTVIVGVGVFVGVAVSVGVAVGVGVLVGVAVGVGVGVGVLVGVAVGVGVGVGVFVGVAVGVGVGVGVGAAQALTIKLVANNNASGINNILLFTYILLRLFWTELIYLFITSCHLPLPMIKIYYYLIQGYVNTYTAMKTERSHIWHNISLLMYEQAINQKVTRANTLDIWPSFSSYNTRFPHHYHLNQYYSVILKLSGLHMHK